MGKVSRPPNRREPARRGIFLESSDGSLKTEARPESFGDYMEYLKPPATRAWRI